MAENKDQEILEREILKVLDDADLEGVDGGINWEEVKTGLVKGIVNGISFATTMRLANLVLDKEMKRQGLETEGSSKDSPKDLFKKSMKLLSKNFDKEDEE